MENKYIFKVGDRVAYSAGGKLKFNQYEDSTKYGTIIALDVGVLEVKWDFSWVKFNNLKLENLVPEEEYRQKYNELELEFNTESDKIKLKMEEASELILEASLSAKKLGFNLVDMYDAVNPLLRAMDNVGWSTSSLNC